MCTTGVICGEVARVDKYISVIVGQRELKWNLYEILKKPGLRKETLLFTDDVDLDDPFPPWTFHTSDQRNPMLYGYRALVIEWDFNKAGYKVIAGYIIFIM